MAEIDIIEDGLVLYLDASKSISYTPGSSTWYDISGNNNHGTLVNGPTYDSANRGSIVFDGQDDYVNFSTYTTPEQTLSNGFTWNVWLFAYNNSSGIIVGNRGPSTEDFIKLTTYRFEYYPYNLGGNMQLNNWINVCVVKNGTTLLYYVNGVLTNSITHNKYKSSSPFYIGGDPWADEYARCKISVVCVYNRALSPEEIYKNYYVLSNRYMFDKNIYFWRSLSFSDTSFLDLIKKTFNKTFTKGLDAKNWLKFNGYYTSYPDIPSDGLVLYLDSSNADSYKGESTINYYDEYVPWTVGGINTDVTGIVNAPVLNSKTWKFEKTGGSNQWNGWESSYDGIFTGNANDIWTISYWYKTDSPAGHTTFNIGYFFKSDWSGLYNSTILYNRNSIIADGEWHFNYTTIRLDENYSNAIVVDGPSLNYSTYSGILYINGLQWEKKAYPTKFVNGTRGTTYETGGGWCDLSYNNKHAEISGNVTYSGANNGTLIVDETGGFIINSGLTSSTNCTVIIFYSTTDDTDLWVKGNNDGSYYLAASYPGSGYYHANVGSPIYYVDLNLTTDPILGGYKDGNYHMFEAKNVNFSAWNSFQWFLYGGSFNLNGKVSLILVYDRNLTALESQQIYKTYKQRFNL